ncbi:MAG: helix-turn-helix transcriptional regulator [Bacteroidetes bacterium]|nr:helix-turn-helix transcriptional regulator [Bacteroidota bacterium]
MLDARQHTQSFPFHTHSTFNITLVLEQVFSTRLLDQYWRAPAGSIVITNPGEVHATGCDHNTGNSFFTFYVSPEVVKELNNNDAAYFQRKVIDDPFLFQQLYKVVQNLNNDTFNTGNALIRTLSRLVKKYAVTTDEVSKKNKLFRHFLEEENIEKFSLETTAQKFGLDKYKFLRLFKSETGLTPNNYIILKRIEKSKLLLEQQDDLLSIAVQSGFYDAAHFCKHFKKITGVTPVGYRSALLCNIIQ